MKVYQFGDQNNKSIMLIPGTCCHWKRTFGEVIPLLEKNYHVLCVSFSGFDKTEDSTYISTLDDVSKIEQYIQENCNGKIDLAYGCSLGGSFVAQLIQRENIHIDNGIIGSSDMDQAGVISAKLQCMIVVPFIYSILQKGKIPKIFQKIIDKQHDDYTNKMMAMFGIGSKDMSFVSKKSIYNQFYTDLITPLNENIDVKNTNIYVFYALKMGEQYLQRYHQYFKNPIIKEFDLQHEELLVCYPTKWCEEIKKII
ncbi:MAG: hypothetical protein LUG12_04945 [Erysipelotrichaceae bacterium]|nr:hypothetical protein [Erysipelotrichaceae bacterium]